MGGFNGGNRSAVGIFHQFHLHIMSVDAGQPLTILRVKRKRNEEPVDALVLSDSKRRKKGLDVFHFVQTVEREDSWDTKDFQVSRLISFKLPIYLNATRNEFLHLSRQRQQKAIFSPPPRLPSPLTTVQPPRPLLSSNSLPLPRDDHRKHLQRLYHIRSC